MEIQSAFSSGVQGFQKAQDDATEAATSIATNLEASEAEFGIGEEKTVDSTEKNASTQQIPDINQASVDLKVAEFQAKASADVIQTADETLGTLLDVRV